MTVALRLPPPPEAILDEKARRHLLDFTTTTHHDYRPAFYHRVICEYCERWAAGEIKRLAIMAPPRRGKSEIVSRRLPAWMMGRDPNIAIMAASFGATLAERNSRDVQRIIMSPEYRRIFPGTRLNERNLVSDARREGEAKRTADEFEIVGHRGLYKCGGAGGPFSGLPGQFIIIDDPYKNRAEAYSRTVREAIWHWAVNDIESRLEPPGCLLIMATRWLSDDLIGRYIEIEGRVEDGGDWTVLEFPEFEDGVDKDKRPYDPRPVGAFLWPGRYVDPDEVEEEVGTEELTRRAAVERAKRIKRSEDVDAALWQQRPRAPGGNIYKDAWMENRFQSVPFEGEFYATCDPKGGSRDPKSSRFVLQLWCKDLPARINLIDQLRGLWSQAECIAVLRTVFMGAPPTPPPGSSIEFAQELRAISTRKSLPIWRRARNKWVEPKADGIAIVDTLCLEIPGMQPYKQPKGSKESRWEASTGWWAAGNVWLPDESVLTWAQDWIAEFLAEMTNVPSYGTDDQADAAQISTDYAFGNPDNQDPWERQLHGVDPWEGYWHEE